MKAATFTLAALFCLMISSHALAATITIYPRVNSTAPSAEKQGNFDVGCKTTVRDDFFLDDRPNPQIRLDEGTGAGNYGCKIGSREDKKLNPEYRYYQWPVTLLTRFYFETFESVALNKVTVKLATSPQIRFNGQISHPNDTINTAIPWLAGNFPSSLKGEISNGASEPYTWFTYLMGDTRRIRMKYPGAAEGATGNCALEADETDKWCADSANPISFGFLREEEEIEITISEPGELSLDNYKSITGDYWYADVTTSSRVNVRGWDEVGTQFDGPGCGLFPVDKMQACNYRATSSRYDRLSARVIYEFNLNVDQADGFSPCDDYESTCVFDVDDRNERFLVPISIDSKSGKDVINLKSEAVDVVLYSRPLFNATLAEVSSATFGPGSAAASDYRTEDVDSDGLDDMIFTFLSAETGIQCGDESAELSGNTLDGNSYVGSTEIQVLKNFGENRGEKKGADKGQKKGWATAFCASDT